MIKHCKTIAEFKIMQFIDENFDLDNGNFELDLLGDDSWRISDKTHYMIVSFRDNQVVHSEPMLIGGDLPFC